MNHKIRENLNEIPIPENLHKRAILGVKEAKEEKRKAKSRVLPAVLSAVIVLSLFFVSSFSPAFAHTLKSLPVISSIFGAFGDKGMQQAEKQGLSHKANQFITIGKSTFQLKDVMYDGARLSLGYHIANYQKEDEIIFSKAALYINGKKFNGGGSGSGAVIQPHEYAGVSTYDLPAEIRDQKGIATLVFNDKQKLHFPIQVSKGGEKEILLNNK